MAVTLISVELIPQSSSIALGRTEQFTLMGYYSDGTRQDLTATATWVSSVTSVATVSIAGVVTSVAIGTTVITGTSGSLSASSIFRVTKAHHTHITPPIIMNTALGHLKFRQSFVYDTPQVAVGPDPYVGHINHKTGVSTIIFSPKSGDPLQNIIEVRADIPAPGSQRGQEGRMVKDSAYPIRPVVESPTSSDSTAGIWRRNKSFSGKIKF